jgi:hypothetical protein
MFWWLEEEVLEDIKEEALEDYYLQTHTLILEHMQSLWVQEEVLTRLELLHLLIIYMVWVEEAV